MEISTINTLFWILPIGLMGLILYRFKPTRSLYIGNDNNVTGKVKSRINSNSLVYLILFIVAIGAFLFFYNKGKSFKPLIHPDEFVKMVDRDEDYTAGVFHKKKWERKVFPDAENKRTMYSYSLINKQSVWTWTSWNGHIFYGIHEEKSYEDYFKFLKNLGATELSKRNYRNYENHIESDETAFLYKNVVFVKRGFISNNGAYTIKIFKFPLLELWDSEQLQTINCIERLDKGTFSDIESNDFVQFLGRKDNSIEFEAKIRGKNITGRAYIREISLVFVDDDDTSVILMAPIHGNCDSLRIDLSVREEKFIFTYPKSK